MLQKVNKQNEFDVKINKLQIDEEDNLIKQLDDELLTIYKTMISLLEAQGNNFIVANKNLISHLEKINKNKSVLSNLYLMLNVHQ